MATKEKFWHPVMTAAEFKTMLKDGNSASDRDTDPAMDLTGPGERHPVAAPLGDRTPASTGSSAASFPQSPLGPNPSAGSPFLAAVDAPELGVAITGTTAAPQTSWLKALFGVGSPRSYSSPGVDLRSIARPQRIPFWSVMLFGRESWLGRKTQVAQEARGAYLLILFTLFVDWPAWFWLVWLMLQGILKEVSKGTPRFELGPQYLLVGMLSVMYPLCFAIFEIQFYRSDTRRGSDSNPVSELLRDLMLSAQRRNITVLLIFASVIALLGIAIAVTVTHDEYRKASITAVVAIVFFLLGARRFGLMPGMVFASRVLLIATAATITSLPWELMMFRQGIVNRHIGNAKAAVFSSMKRMHERLGSPTPEEFDLATLSQYESRSQGPAPATTPLPGQPRPQAAAPTEFGELRRVYLSCMQKEVAGRMEIPSLSDAWKQKQWLQALEQGKACTEACRNRVLMRLTSPSSECDEAWRRIVGNTSLTDLCKLPAKELRNKYKRAKIEAQLAEEEAKLAKLVADAELRKNSLREYEKLAALAHQKCRASDEYKNLLDARTQLPMQLLPFDSIGKDGKPEAPTEFRPALCQDVVKELRMLRLCVEEPDLAEQLRLLSEMKQSYKIADWLALGIALILPILVMLNKLNASDELIETLGHRADWLAAMPKASKEELMAVILSRDRDPAERQQALITLLHRYDLTDRERAVIRALDLYQLGDILARFPVIRSGR